MPTRNLPLRPDLEQLKRQARELRRDHAAGRPAAAARVAERHPRHKGRPAEAILGQPLKLADAQLVIAREYGFESWARLKERVDIGRRVAEFAPHPRFDEAVAAMDLGELERFRGLVAADPALVHARTNLEPPYDYFTGATLLHHVAGNPDRGRFSGRLPPLPANTVEMARLLLDRGADVDAVTLGPNGGTTMGLVLTSKHASDVWLSGPLIELLLEYGAKLDPKGPAGKLAARRSGDVLHLALANHAPRAAEKLIELGAEADVCAAAALGRMDLLRDCFDAGGRLRSRPRRGGKLLSERDAIGLAMLLAYVNGHPEAVDFLLEKDGNWDMTGVNNGTALHRAAWEGDLAMVRRLVARGADLSNRDNPFGATPLSWAYHNKQGEVIRWVRANGAIDLHDAVCFDLREHVEARLREDPASVNARRDQWNVPRCTPLYWAAWPHYSDIEGRHSHAESARAELVQLLLDRGADVNAVAGNGLTPLDVAVSAEAPGLAALLERHVGRRAADL